MDFPESSLYGQSVRCPEQKVRKIQEEQVQVLRVQKDFRTFGRAVQFQAVATLCGQKRPKRRKDFGQHLIEEPEQTLHACDKHKGGV